MRTLLFLVLPFLLFASDIPFGGYRTFEEFVERKPSIPSTWTMKQITPEESKRGYYVEMVYIDSATGLERKFKRIKDGKLWGYVDSTGFYFNYRGILSQADVAGDTAWFYGMEELVSADFNSGIEGYEWHEDFLLLDLKRGKTSYLSPRKVDKIIRSDKELSKEYKEVDERRVRMAEFLNRYFKMK